MKALISPNENNRIAQVANDNEVFEVSEPLYWIDCPADCVADLWRFDGVSAFIAPEPQPVEAAPAA